MAQLNTWENAPIADKISPGSDQSIGSLYLQGFVLDNSISWNTPTVLKTGSVTFDISLGLYSLNGSTLSLANSASANLAAGFSFFTFVTSATQNLTPGNWWFGFLKTVSISGINGMLSVDVFVANAQGAYGGGLVDGIMSVSTNALPSSIATSNVNKQGASGVVFAPGAVYVLLS